MNDLILAMMENAEHLQDMIMSWVDFAWKIVQHPFVSFLLGAFGYGVIRDKKAIGAGAKKLIPKKKQ